MRTKVVLAHQYDAIDQATKILKMDGIIAFPTDTVYGLGALVQNENSIEKLFLAKGRGFNKAIAVLIGDVGQLPMLTPNFNEVARKLAGRFWPGELTLVVEKSTQIPKNLSPLPTIGIRMPNHTFTREMLFKTGPLATTSANISGGRNPLSAQDVLDELEGKIDLVIDGGASPGGIPSTVVDCTREEPRIIRAGGISEDEIKKTLS